MRNKIKIFFHIATIGGYQNIVDSILDTVFKSGLIDLADELILSVVGEGEVKFPINNKIRIERIPDIPSGEFYTLEKIKEFSDSCDYDYKVLYIHTKGVTTPDNDCIIDWRDYMVHFNIDKCELAIKELDDYDTYGVDLVNEPVTHYSGNFWWAKSSYIKKLPPISEITGDKATFILTPRHNAEFWIGMSEGRHKSAHNSNINVYERHLNRYPKFLYI